MALTVSKKLVVTMTVALTDMSYVFNVFDCRFFCDVCFLLKITVFVYRSHLLAHVNSTVSTRNKKTPEWATLLCCHVVRSTSSILCVLARVHAKAITKHQRAPFEWTSRPSRSERVLFFGVRTWDSFRNNA